MIHLQSLLGAEQLARIERLAVAAPAGALVEVGVYRGGSARVLERVALAKSVPLWLYDTFAGLPWCDPEMGDVLALGQFADGLTLDECTYLFPGARVQCGVFPHDVVLPEDIAFVHLDVDQYQSVRESLDVLLPRLVPGGAILIDDYMLPGCKRAVHETPHTRGAMFRLHPAEDGRAVLRRLTVDEAVRVARRHPE